MDSSFLDLFWNPTVRRNELKGVARAALQSRIHQSTRSARLREEVEELQRQTAYLALVLGSVLEELDTRGVITRESLRARIDEVDRRDGATDGRVDARAAEEAGAPVAGFDTKRHRESVAPEPSTPAAPETPIVRRRRRR